MRLLGIFLVATVAANDADKFCPSKECWNYDAGKPQGQQCTLKSATGPSDCAHSITCNPGTMELSFNKYVFGEVHDAAAISTDACISGNQQNGFTWVATFGSCGMAAPVKDGTQIAFSKTFTVTRAAGIPVGGKTIFTSATGGVTITFTCKYDGTASASSGPIDIETPTDVTADVTESNGKFDTGLSLAFYTANDYAQVLNAAQNIGSTMYARVTWAVTTLKNQVGFYIRKCTVEDVSNGNVGINIVDKSCYAKVVSAKPFGAKFAISDVTASLEYKSFSYDTAASDSQILKCEIEFCVPSGGGNGCTNAIATIQSDCPSGQVEDTYQYTPTGN